jgi:predicted RNase H-related nuclease YkuK (DUF458 family)
MKTKFKTAGLLFSLILIVAICPLSQGKEIDGNKAEEDTIIVNFGKKGKMVIYVDNKEDFKALKAYDLNALLSKINIYLDSTYQEDIMNDTSFTFHTPYSIKPSAGQGEATIRVERVEDNINDIERKLEETAEELEEAAEDIENLTVRIGSLHVDINPKESDEEKVKVYHKTPEEKRIRHYFNFHLGLNNYFEKDHIPSNEQTAYVLSPLRSRYFAINYVQKYRIASPFFITTGVELAFNNYMFRDEIRINKSNGTVAFEPVERDVRKSKLATTYVNIPLMAVLDFNNKFHLGVGGYVGYRLGSHSKIKYSSGDDIKDKERSNFYLNDWRYGIRGIIGVRDVKLFVNYDLNTLFRGTRGPEVNAISFGVVI